MRTTIVREQFQHLTARKPHRVAVERFVVVKAAGAKTQLDLIAVDVHLDQVEWLFKDCLLNPWSLCWSDLYVHDELPLPTQIM
ncbi:hypothetical protein CYK37_24420 [Mesorhizobium loti]|nr:hypothetical protein [Mesorhizobium loti]PLP56588.1 hypothetical protein CYK37_24420 [Mesorhizobium loti]